MRKIVVAMVALALPFVGAGPAAAEPARASSAAAYGLLATGTVPIGAQVPVAAAQPPDQDAADTELVEVPLGGLAFAGAVDVTANAHRADDITPLLAGIATTPLTSNPVTIQGGANSRGVAKTTGAALVFTPPAGELDAVTLAFSALADAAGGLLGADSITAEAVAKCVNGARTFETGFEIVGLGGLVGGVLDPVVQPLLDTLLALLPPGSTLASVISIEPGRVTQIPDGFAIDGLVVKVPLLMEEIVISHAEARMPAGDCRVAPPAGPPTGPGDVAPTGTLAATGSSPLLLPVALGLLATAAGLRYLNRRSRRASA